MKKKALFTMMFALTMAAVSIAGCGSSQAEAPASAQTTEAAAQTAVKKDKNDLIASSEEMIEVEKVVEEGMVPITAD